MKWTSRAVLPDAAPMVAETPPHDMMRLEHGVALAVPLPDQAMSCAQAVELLTAPLKESYGRPYSIEAVWDGLRDYTYPNSTFTKNTKPMGREMQAALRQMRPDIARLVSMSRAEARQDAVIVPIHIASEIMTPMFARDHLVRMKPTELADFCKNMGLPVNELALWRLKGGDRQNREVRMHELDEKAGMDSLATRNALVETLFKRLTILSKEAGAEVVLAQLEDVEDGWLRDVTFGELVQDHGMGQDFMQHWDVKFRSGAIVKRQIIPVIGWAAVGERMDIYSHRRVKPDYRVSRLHFDETTRTLTQFSPVIGAALVSRFLRRPHRDELHRMAYQLYKYNPDSNRNIHPYHRAVTLPRAAIAAWPAILTRPEFREGLVANRAFRTIEQSVIPHAEDMRAVGDLRFNSEFYHTNGASAGLMRQF